MKCTSALPMVWLLLCFASSEPLSAQFVNITDAPFTATVVWTRDGQPNATEEFARASNGSTYDATKATDGHLVHITIVDVPNNRRIELMPSPPSYTYWLRETGRVRTSTVEEYRTILQRLQDHFLQNPDRDKAEDGSHRHQIALGVREGNGMTLFGNREEINLASGEKRIVEAWQSDLGVAATFAEKGTATQTVRTLTNLRRVEPDPKLFEIPAEYLPHADPLLDGKKVFVDNETGIPEVKSSAAAGFNAFGTSRHPWKVVDSMDEADIVAVFVNVVCTDDLDPPFEMKIHVPRSDETLFVSHLRRNPDAKVQSYLAYEKSLSASCVGDLWNRVVNTRIGPVGSAAPVPRAMDQSAR